MPGFASEDELYKYVGGIFERAFADPELGPKLQDTGMVLETRCTDPDSSLVVDLGKAEVHHGADSPVQPDAVLLMTTETANAYWQGKVNLTIAMARKQIKVEGSTAKLLSLAPLAKQLYPGYIETLRADGREDLIV